MSALAEIGTLTVAQALDDLSSLCQIPIWQDEP